MHAVGLRVVELAVPDPGASRHSLHVTGADHRTGADAVLVLERAVEHVRDDLHVAMPVRVEPFAGGDPVFIDDPERAEAHEARVVVVAERECVFAIEPTEVRLAALFRFAYCRHVEPPVSTLSVVAARSAAALIGPVSNVGSVW